MSFLWKLFNSELFLFSIKSFPYFLLAFFSLILLYKTLSFLFVILDFLVFSYSVSYSMFFSLDISLYIFDTTIFGFAPFKFKSKTKIFFSFIIPLSNPTPTTLDILSPVLMATSHSIFISFSISIFDSSLNLFFRKINPHKFRSFK